MKYNWIYIFFILSILIYLFMNTNTTVENFTPTIRKLYRPYVRKSRIYYQYMYNKNTQFIFNIFRKYGII